MIGELGCTFKEYEQMTWAEFQLRLFSFNRVEKNNWFKIGEIVEHNQKEQIEILNHSFLVFREVSILQLVTEE